MKKITNFDQMMKNIEQELLDLKTTHDIGASVTPYYYNYTPTSVTSLTITYADGVHDIITQVFTDGDSVLGPVSGNTQTLFFTAQTSATIWLVSTRPILNVA